MTRLMLLAMLSLATGAANAAILTQFEHEPFLRDHETVRYRIDIDYGSNPSARVDVDVRGLSGPPRVRVLDSRNKELKDARDTSGDWTLEFGFTANTNHDAYFVEVDCANPSDAASFSVLLTVSAEATTAADASISIDRYYFDHESGDDSDHYDCAANPAAGLWAILPVGALALLATRRRRATQ